MERFEGLFFSLPLLFPPLEDAGTTWSISCWPEFFVAGACVMRPGRKLRSRTWRSGCPRRRDSSAGVAGVRACRCLPDSTGPRVRYVRHCSRCPSGRRRLVHAHWGRLLTREVPKRPGERARRPVRGGARRCRLCTALVVRRGEILDGGGEQGGLPWTLCLECSFRGIGHRTTAVETRLVGRNGLVHGQKAAGKAVVSVAYLRE